MYINLYMYSLLHVLLSILIHVDTIYCYIILYLVYIYRPVGWSGDGGVRESNKVELMKSGGGSRRGRSPLSPS